MLLLKPYHSLNVDERIAQGDKVLFILPATAGKINRYIVSFKELIFIHPRSKEKKRKAEKV